MPCGTRSSTKRIDFSDGVLRPSAGVGLGVTLNEETVARYRVD